MAHSAAEARALLFNRKLKCLPVDFEIPDLPELTGELAVLELKAIDLTNAEKEAQTPDGQDDILMMAATTIKSLVMLDTKERVLQDNDLNSVAEWGISVLKPLSDLVLKVSNIGQNTLQNTKEQLAANPTSDLATSSTGNSAEVAQV